MLGDSASTTPITGRTAGTRTSRAFRTAVPRGARGRCGRLLAPGEINHILADCTPKLLITSPLFLDKAREAIEGLADPPKLIIVGDPVSEDTLSWSSLMADASPDFTTVDRADEDIAVIMYTGGTTGTPKGVELSHGNIRWNATTLMEATQLPQGVVAILTLPLAHLFGMIVGATGQVIGGRGVILEWFTPDGVLQAIQDHKGEYLPMVPTMMTLLLQHEGADQYDTSSLKTVFASAAPVAIELAEAFEKAFDCEVIEAYGQTEAAPAIALMRPGIAKKAGSTGPPLPGVADQPRQLEPSLRRFLNAQDEGGFSPWTVRNGPFADRRVGQSEGVGGDGYGRAVPRISSFYGIAILMYFDDHNPPHFHAQYGESQARIAIGGLEPMDEGLPSRALRLVLEWAALHRKELMQNWEKARAGEPLDKIEPLA